MNLKIGNLNINYCVNECKNSKNYVLFLHGFGGSIKSFEGLQNSLSSSINTINLDLIGFGKSSKPPSHFSIYDYAEIVYQFLKMLNITKVTIVAHSFGGRIAIILASKYKELVQKLALIDSAGLKPKFCLKTFLRIKQYKLLKTLVKLKIVNKKILNRFGSSDYKALSSDEKQVFNRIIKQDLSYALKDITSSTLIIWGKLDKDTPLYMAKKLNKYIINSGLIVFENAGHYSYLDEATKSLLILKSFLNLGE